MNQQTPDPGGLRQALVDLLETQALEDERTLAELDRRAAAGEPVYSAILATLTHLQLPEPQARQHWRRIRSHRDRLRDQIGRDVGLRVAALDYLLNLSGDLRNPKLVELAAFEQLERSAFTDALTGLHNRAFFEQAFRRELKRARRGARALALLLLDVDDFKRVNDRFGHAAGDRVLASLGRLVRRTLREIDLAARFGGEELVLLLPETSREGARVAAERLRLAIAEGFAGKVPAVTVSVGAAASPEDGLEAEELLAAADRALYRAKGEGRNRVALAGSERRQHPRLPLGGTLHLRTGAAERVARAHNVSRGGLLVSVSEPMAVGSLVEVDLPDCGAAPLCGEVVRVQEPMPPAEVFELAVRLLADPDEALGGLVAPQAS